MSLAGRLVNVLAAPGEVFDEVKAATASVANWMTPAVLLILVSWVGAWFIFSQPAIQHQLTEIGEKAIQKQIDKGKLPKDQADKAREAAAKWSGLGSKIGAVVAPVFAGILTPVWWGLIVWLAGTKALKGQFPFIKAVEVAGLANMIGVLGAILKILLILITGSAFASPSLALLVKEFDPQNKAHTLLALANPMTFWFLAVVAIGLARLSNTSLGRAVVWVFGIWAAYTAVLVGVGMAIQSVFAG